MSNTLVIIGHHTEETEFGEAVREHAKDSDLNFYRVMNSYQNGSNSQKPSAVKVQRAEEEILEEMSLREPSVTIDIHTTKGNNAMCLAELIALHEFERLQPVQTSGSLYPVEEFRSVHVERFMPIVRDSRLQRQQRFPYIVLEMYLNPNPSKLPYQAQVEFAATVINSISALY